MTGSKSKILYRPLPADDPTQRMPDVILAGKVLSCKPVVMMDEGLKKTIDYFTKELSS